MAAIELDPTWVTDRQDTTGSSDYVGGGFYSSPAAPHQYLYFIREGNNRFFEQNRAIYDPHYESPDSSNFIIKGMMGFLIPEMAGYKGTLAELNKSILTEAEFNSIKAAATKSNLLAQFALAGYSANEDIQNGVPHQVAIATQTALLVGATLLTVSTAGFGLPVALAVGLMASLAIEAFGAQSFLNEYFAGILGLPLPSPDESNENQPGLTGYQFHQAIMKIIENPAEYPDAEKMISDALKEISNIIIGNEVDGHQVSELTESTPSIINLSEIEVNDGGQKVFDASDSSGAFLFVTDESGGKIIGGNGTNWFLIKDTWAMDFLSRNQIIGGSGVNILDFSNTDYEVHMMLSGNDYKNEKISELMSLYGPHFLDEDMAMTLRNGQFPWLGTEYASLYDEYKNIDIIIGSPWNDVLVGDWIGGNTISGGYGNDHIVVHGGSNVIKFYDSDFSLPGEELITKTVHGLTLAQEAEYFNGMNYTPSLGYYYRLEHDTLDFSAMDADLTTDDKQNFNWIGYSEFSGTAGELRLTFDLYSPQPHYIEGDRDGDGVADFVVAYEIYYTNPYVRMPWSPLIDAEEILL
ncbi:hypothetical protein [Pseudomonas sp. LRF_L74]|uniref:hypothetical protein n=1 Tax=Pseudomonas sp. LRF_L74 TaxID=3369422 RepID=UPI003F5E01E4